MDMEALEKKREQAAKGREAEQVRPVLARYLTDLRARTVEELSLKAVSDEKLRELQSRLYVISQISGMVLGDIMAGRAAEQQLREVDEAEGVEQ